MDSASAYRELAVEFESHRVELSLSEAASEVLSQLDRRWLKSAIIPLTLTFPTSTVMLRIYLSDTQPLEDLNTLTDIRPTDAGLPDAHGVIILRPKAGSLMPPQQRYLLLPSAAVLSGQAPCVFVKPDSLKGKAMSQVYRRLYGKIPLLLDHYRQSRNSAYRQTWQASAPALQAAKVNPTVAVDSSGGVEQTERDDQSESQRPWMWVAMHWLEPGGAEEWAFRQAELAREAGYQIVITADRGAPQRLLGRAYGITDEVYLCAQTFGQRERGAFVAKLLRRYRPQAIHIHHSLLAYENLGLIRTLLPKVRIEDSVHIVEHRGGGYVADSVRASQLIDLHHVISPQLREIYRREAGIKSDKIAYYPLTGLTAPGASDSSSTKADNALSSEPLSASAGRKLRVGFLGRLSLQKRPFLFVDVARRLHAANPGGFEFLLQGSGELEHYTHDQIARAGLTDVLQTRQWGPVADFLAEIDILLITSDNEGLTLTSLESSSAGVLVVSADVGSQLTVVAPGALLPRGPKKFARGAVALLNQLAADDTERVRLLARQRGLVADLAAKPSAQDFYAEHYRTTCKPEN